MNHLQEGADLEHKSGARLEAGQIRDSGVEQRPFAQRISIPFLQKDRLAHIVVYGFNNAQKTPLGRRQTGLRRARLTGLKQAA